MTIGCNKYQLFGKIIILTLGLFLVTLFTYHKSKMNFENAPIGGVIFLVAVWLLLCGMLFLMTLQLIILPKGVEIDELNKKITLDFLLTKHLKIPLNEITEFSTIIITTKSTAYDCLVIKVENGNEYILGDFNLKDYKPIKVFFENNNIKFARHFKFSFITYFIKYFKRKTSC